MSINHQAGYISWFLKEVKEQNEKKIDLWPRIEPASGQNKFESGPFSALSNCVNEAVVRDECIIVTSSFSETKGFFCFSFNKRSPEDALGKCVFRIRNISKRKQTSGEKSMQNIV